MHENSNAVPARVRETSAPAPTHVVPSRHCPAGQLTLLQLLVPLPAYPVAQLSQTAFDDDVQVGPEAQSAMGAQAEQTVSVVAVPEVEA